MLPSLNWLIYEAILYEQRWLPNNMHVLIICSILCLNLTCSSKTEYHQFDLLIILVSFAIELNLVWAINDYYMTICNNLQRYVDNPIENATVTQTEIAVLSDCIIMANGNLIFSICHGQWRSDLNAFQCSKAKVSHFPVEISFIRRKMHFVHRYAVQ